MTREWTYLAEYYVLVVVRYTLLKRVLLQRQSSLLIVLLWLPSQLLVGRIGVLVLKQGLLLFRPGTEEPLEVIVSIDEGVQELVLQGTQAL